MSNLQSTTIVILLTIGASAFFQRIHHNNLCELKKASDDSVLPVQCKGEVVDGRCFCYSPTGERIFGSIWWSAKEVKNMTCACSRERNRLETILGRKDVSLHCTYNGNYEKLQCDNGLCWCVESKTGQPIQRVYPQYMMKHLPCYKKKSQYLTQCESKALARAAILQKLEAHGRFNTHIDMALCDADGSYQSYKVEKNNVFCVWKDNERIDVFQATANNLRGMNCHCARDTKIFAEENLDISIICENNGNYRPSQISDGRPYCVDGDGCATTDLGGFGEPINC